MRNKKLWIIVGAAVLLIVIAGVILWLLNSPEDGEKAGQILQQDQGDKESGLNSDNSEEKEPVLILDDSQEKETQNAADSSEQNTGTTDKNTDAIENQTTDTEKSELPMVPENENPLPSEPGGGSQEEPDQEPSNPEAPSSGTSEPIELPFVPFG